MLFFLGKIDKINIIEAKTNIQIISLSKILESVIKIGLIIVVNPKTEPILKILDPIKFPIEIPFSFLAIAITDVASSGILVPIAITETDITASLTPIDLAKSMALETNHSAP
jgi:hypothetical protein